jgi:DNA repair photolyase
VTGFRSGARWIPGLNDREVPAILSAAKDAGARRASMVFLRLPHGVKELFDAWLARHRPGERGKVLDRVRASRGGELYNATFGSRMTGDGPYAGQVELFDVTCARLGPESRAAATVDGRVQEAAP